MEKENRRYVDFDRFPKPMIMTDENDPLKHYAEDDIPQVQRWVREQVSTANNVYAIITGKASKFLFVVAACELSTCENVSKIGCAPIGMPPVMAMDFSKGCEN